MAKADDLLDGEDWDDCLALLETMEDRLTKLENAKADAAWAKLTASQAKKMGKGYRNRGESRSFLERTLKEEGQPAEIIREALKAYDE